MNQGVEMLLARMESNPEEFAFQFDTSWAAETDLIAERWRGVMYEVIKRRTKQLEKERGVVGPEPVFTNLPFLDDEEVGLLYDKYVSLQGDAFTRFVMGTLLGANEKEDAPAKWTTGSISANQIKLGALPTGVVSNS